MKLPDFIAWLLKRSRMVTRLILVSSREAVGFVWSGLFPFALALLVYFFVEEAYLTAIGAEKASKIAVAALFGAIIAGATFIQNTKKAQRDQGRKEGK